MLAAVLEAANKLLQPSCAHCLDWIGQERILSLRALGQEGFC